MRIPMRPFYSGIALNGNVVKEYAKSKIVKKQVLLLDRV